MKHVRDILTLLAMIALLGGSWWLGRRSVEVRTVTRVDTVYYERPTFVSTSDRIVSVQLPRLVFVPADTVIQTVVVREDDSVTMQVPLRTVEYTDSTYYARVVGPVIGDLEPRLDFIRTYERTTTQLVRQQTKWEVGIEGTVGFRSQNLSLYAERHFGRFRIGATAGYDFHSAAPVVEINAGFTLWSK